MKQTEPRRKTRPIVLIERSRTAIAMAIVVLSVPAVDWKAIEAFAGDRAPGRIVVYTVTGLPVAVPRELAGITDVIRLDRIVEIEAALAAGLERLDPEIRTASARNRLTGDIRKELAEAWRGLARIRAGEIERLPAIVIDGRAVWYGRNLRRAALRYRNLEERQ